MNLTHKELNALFMSTITLKEQMLDVLIDPGFNKLAKRVAEDIVTNINSLTLKIEEATGVKANNLEEYKKGDEKEFIINPKLN